MSTYKSPSAPSQKPIIYLSKQSTVAPPYDKTLDEWFTISGNKSQNSSSQTTNSSSDESHTELRSLMTSPTSISSIPPLPLTSNSTSEQLTNEACPCCHQLHCSSWKKILKSITKLENETRLAAEIGQSLLQKNDIYLLEKNQLKEQLQQCQNKNDDLHLSLDETESYVQKLLQEKDKWMWQYEKSQKLLIETETDLESVNQKCNLLLNDLDLANTELEKLKHYELMTHQSDRREDTLQSKLEDLKQELTVSRKNELTTEVKYKKLMARYESLSCSYQDLCGRLPSTKNTNLVPTKPLSTITPPTAADIQQASTDELVVFIKELVSSNNGLKSELLDTQNRLDEILNSSSNNNSGTNSPSPNQNTNGSITSPSSSKFISKTKSPSTSSKQQSPSSSSSSIKKNEKPIIKPRRHRSTNAVLKSSSSSLRSKSREKGHKTSRSMTTPPPPLPSPSPQATISTPPVIHHHYHYYVNNQQNKKNDQQQDNDQQPSINKVVCQENHFTPTTSMPIPILSKTSSSTSLSLSPHREPSLPIPSSLSNVLSYHSLPNPLQEDFISKCLMMDQQHLDTLQSTTISSSYSSTSSSSISHSPSSLPKTKVTKSTMETKNNNQEGEEKTPYTSLLTQTQHILQRLSSTDIRSLNRKLERTFDMNELTTMSNAILQNIQADIETMDARFLWLSSSSSSYSSSDHHLSMPFKVNEFFSIVQLIQDLLKEQCNLFITLNHLQAAYVNKIQENDQKLENELLLQQSSSTSSIPIKQSTSSPSSTSNYTSNYPFHETTLNPIHWLSSLIQGDMNQSTTSSSNPTTTNHPNLSTSPTSSLSSSSFLNHNNINNNNCNNNNKSNHVNSMKKKQLLSKKDNASINQSRGFWQSFSSLFDDNVTNSFTTKSTTPTPTTSTLPERIIDNSTSSFSTTKWLGK
ncbi:hypothetical protein BJ944DRAFT_271426 [Cunninghamella echinulata]|nr:hypothetical protein BJ944DRAFT_271426 [Cunninghamella echinulata]